MMMMMKMMMNMMRMMVGRWRTMTTVSMTTWRSVMDTRMTPPS